MKIQVFWFRRDLRLQDNTGLNAALQGPLPVLPIFIFDSDILDDLDTNDARVTFIQQQLKQLNSRLTELGSGLQVYHGAPLEIWQTIIESFDVAAVYTNHDYEPYALARDSKVGALLGAADIPFRTFKDHVIFEKSDVTKSDGSPYTVYTPYKRAWLQKWESSPVRPDSAVPDNFHQQHGLVPELHELGFVEASLKVPDYSIEPVGSYEDNRNTPFVKTTHLGPHLRFGTVSIRGILSQLQPEDETFRNQLIWREFFIQILYHFPQVVEHSFHAKYDRIAWENDETKFKRWCAGNTGYPLVDAGMRELNTTGYMHNRVRMVAASFLTKDLLIDWRWGEAYFASKLLDYELASNNGSWQWCAGTGCDAAPYFRIFNPTSQQERFDPEYTYVQKWVPEYQSASYPEPMVNHNQARKRCLERYKQATSAS